MSLERRWVMGMLVLAAALVLVMLMLAPLSVADSNSAGRSASAGLQDDQLLGLSCLSMRLCTAVGSTAQFDEAGRLVAARWDGSTWSVQLVPTPPEGNGFLGAVSCSSSVRCAAVGASGSPDDSSAADHRSLAARWNGSSWSLQPVPVPRNAVSSELLSVSCPVSTSCEAVGYYMPGPPKYGYAAVGLAERWNGRRWSIQKPALPLAGVSCPARTGCFAVGSYGFEQWSGKHWRIQRPTDIYPLLDAVSCSSSDGCTAVGSEPGVIYRWNGKRWRVQNRGDAYHDLYAVFCPSHRSCTAVGDYSPDGSDRAPWAGQWTGGAWSFNSDIFLPPSYGGFNAWLTSVYCASTTACIALGATDGTQQSFVSTWDGTSWSSTAP